MSHSYHADIARDAAERSQRPVSLEGVARSQILRAELDRYAIAMVSESLYEWGGSRYGNAPDAIAAAKRGSKAPGRTKHR
jgi:hypothetical protein